MENVEVEGMMKDMGKIVQPEEVGYDKERLEVLNTHFNRLIEEEKIQAAWYCLSREGKIFARDGVGRASYKKNEKKVVNPDVVNGVYSITKLFTSTAIFKLCEDGFIRPNQAVAEILPEFNKAPFNGITIAHLLSHTSGLYPDNGCFNYEYISPWDFKFIKKNMSEKDSWFDAALKTGMHNKPGKEWAYSTFGFVVLGEIIAKVTRMRAETYIRKALLEPCKMEDSFFVNEFYFDLLPPEFAKRILPKFYLAYEWSKDTYEIIKRCADGKKSDFMTNPNFSEHFRMKYSHSTTGNGLFSTVDDLNKFGRMLLNGGYTDDGVRVIGRKAIERMTLNYTTEDIKDNCWGAGGAYRMYGLGPDTRRTADNHYSEGSYFHEGWGACCLLLDPKEKMVASWFVPFLNDGWYPEALYNASAVMWSGIK